MKLNKGMDQMDRTMRTGREACLTNLLDIIESRADGSSGAAWWGPVVGSDEDQPSDFVSPGVALEILSDEKPGSLTVCEE